MPKRLTDEEKVERYNERIRLQMIQNKKWVENNKQKYQELMASYSRNYYQKNKEMLNKKRTEYNRKKKELASKVPLPDQISPAT
jgi:CRISPR/Cas system-associated endonuclease/helicase Cas3